MWEWLQGWQGYFADLEEYESDLARSAKAQLRLLAKKKAEAKEKAEAQKKKGKKRCGPTA